MLDDISPVRVRRRTILAGKPRPVEWSSLFHFRIAAGQPIYSLVPREEESEMPRKMLRKMLEKYKTLIHAEADYMKGFMALLMKPRNTDMPWTRTEIRALKRYIWHLAHYVPFVIIFLLPFGSLLLPVMAEVLDRRRERRPQ